MSPSCPAGVNDPPAYVHREIARRLVEHLDGVRIDARRIAEWSVPAGVAGELIAQRFARATMVRLAEAGTSDAGGSLVACTPEGGALGDEWADLLLSNLALHRIAGRAAVLREFARILAPGGYLMMSAFGPDTAREAAGPEDPDPVRALRDRFPDMHDLGDLALSAGFADVVVETERLTTHCDGLHALLRDWRALGEAGRIVPAAAGRGLPPSRAFRLARERFDAKRGASGVPLTLEIVYLHAHKPAKASVEIAFPTT